MENAPPPGRGVFCWAFLWGVFVGEDFFGGDFWESIFWQARGRGRFLGKFFIGGPDVVTVC
jgi:hypothetical protein